MKRRYKLLLGIIFFAVVLVSWLIYPAPGVPMLAYHMVNPQDELYSIHPAQFEQHMQYLAENGYTAISLKEFYQGVAQQGNLPVKPVIITFDDGYQDNLTTALPIMEKYGMKGTVFMVAGDVGKPGYLTWEQLKEMQSRNTEIGSHTLSHVKLKELSFSEQLDELAASKKLLESQLGKPVEFLAYPFGGFDENTSKALQQSGYLGACTGKPGLNTKHTAPYALKRISIPQPKYGMWEFRLRLLRANIYEKIGKK